MTAPPRERCASEDDCTHMPWCKIRGECQRFATAPPAAQPAEPPDDLVARLRDHASQYTDHSDLWGEAADVIERQAREIADLTRLQERNEGRIKAIVDDALLQRAERAEAERDALRADAP